MRVFLSLLVLLALPAAAHAGGPNPADELSHLPIEASIYDKATHCSSKPRPGMLKLQRWLEDNVRGVFWGSYRCEKWGKHEASLHAENRALDWHLDAGDRADHRAAHRDHLHIGMTRAGAKAQTSFWRRHTG